MNTTTPAVGSTGASSALLHLLTGSAELPEFQAKPTSLTGQSESTLVVWENAAGASTGVWECEPGEFTSERNGVSEVCHIISGRGSIVGDDGTRAELEPGSLLVLPNGWRGRWIIRETIRKTFVTIPDSTTAASAAPAPRS